MNTPSLRKIFILLCLVTFGPAQFYFSLGQSYGKSNIPVTIVHPDDAIKQNDIRLFPLKTRDVMLYKNIFKLQAKGNWTKADKLIAKLKNKILMGHVLYQRFMHPNKYRSSYTELANWMLKYPDHPGANKIYALAKRKNGRKERELHRPIPTMSFNFPADKPYRLSKVRPKIILSKTVDPYTDLLKSSLSKANRIDIYNLKKKIKRYLRRGNADRAEKHLWAFKRRNLLSETKFNRLLGNIAASYYFNGRDSKALALGKIAAESSRDVIYSPDWISGLAAWRLGNCALAARYFEKVATSTIAGDWMVSAGAFWAARSYLVCHDPKRVNQLLHIAARLQRTFYGLIATRQLGQIPDLNWVLPAFTNDHYALIKDFISVKRAIALAQTDKTMLADMELSRTWQRTDDFRHEALLGLAARLGLAGTQLKIGRIEEQKRMTALDSVLYPIPNTEPEDGFKLDRALMFAIMRQESEFNSWAKSHAGARGLMQIMPRTASEISQDRSLRYGSQSKLDDPRYNMALGQQYIRNMLNKNHTGGNLFKTLTAYNAGPGNLKKWERKINFQDDPLLFIESIPANETRNYIERVISNYWIYRMRMQQPANSLNTVAMGEWPMYIAQDKKLHIEKQKYAYQ